MRWNAGFLLVIVITVVMFFFQLGSVPLLDPDEPVYAETAKEMIAVNDFVSPRIYGEYWYDKPPMYYWLVAGSDKLFGVSEFSARFPSALLGLACVLVVYYFARKRFSELAAVSSAMVLATSILFFYLAKAAVTDMTLTLCLTVALLAFLDRKYYLFYLFSALATVTKGPIGFLFPGAIICLHILVTRSFERLKEMKVFSGALVFLVVAMPWYYRMYQLHGDAFVDTFIGYHNITRFMSPEHPDGVLWYYYIPVLLLGFFPWTAMLGQAVWSSLQQRGRDFTYLAFLNLWAGFIFLFFSISRTKLPSYILPLFPPVAMLVGWYIDRMLQARQRSGKKIWGILFGGLSAVVLLVLYLGQRDMPEVSTSAVLLAADVGIMSLVGVFFIWRGQLLSAFWTKVAGMTVFAVLLVSLLVPAISPKFSSAAIAGAFQKVYDGQSPVYIVKFLHPGVTFYTGVYGTELHPEQDLNQVVASSGHAYFILRQNEYDHLSEPNRRALAVVAVKSETVLLYKK